MRKQLLWSGNQGNIENAIVGLSQFEPGKISSKFTNLFGRDDTTDSEKKQPPPKKKLITLDQVMKKESDKFIWIETLNCYCAGCGRWSGNKNWDGERAGKTKGGQVKLWMWNFICIVSKYSTGKNGFQQKKKKMIRINQSLFQRYPQYCVNCAKD